MNQDKKIIFVYNADGGFFNALTDAVHKALSPATYQCNLCKLTYGNLNIKQQWEEFVKALPHPAQFLHRDEFRVAHPALKNTKLPALFIVHNNKLTLALEADRINQARTIEDLTSMVSEVIKSQL